MFRKTNRVNRGKTICGMEVMTTTKQIYEFSIDDAKRFADEHGIRVRVKGSELQFERCPYCRNQTDKKNKFAMNIRTGAFNCLRASCGAKGNMLTLARDFGFSLGRDVDEYYNRSRKFRSLRKFPAPKVKTEAVKYLEGRGISQAITEKYKVAVSKDDPNILIFLFYDERGELQLLKYRKTDFDPERDNNKEWCMADCKPILFGMDQCDVDNSGMLVMTEGQIDSLSVAEAFDGDINVVSVPFGKNGFTWVPYCWDFLCRYKTLVVFGDYERDEITLLDEMRRRFPGKVMHVQPKDYRECKDANDLLRKHGKEAVRHAVMNATITENPKIVQLADVKRRDLNSLEKVKTGIPQLDKMIGGMYLGQLVLLTGERGLGKSTVGSQLCIQALDQGYTVFAYSGELNDWMFQDWTDRQCAGPDNVNVRVHSNGFNEYTVSEDIRSLIHEWYRDRFYLYDNHIIDGAEDESLIRIIETAINQYGCRVIFLDNLMTAMEDDLSADLYRQQGNFVRKLVEMARRLNVLIILVVHPRKGSGRDFVNDDIAGSGNITNLADLVIRYARPKEDNPGADRIIQVTKNRLTGGIHFKDNGIPLYFDDKSKRIASTPYGGEVGSLNFRLGWMDMSEDEDGFLTLPEEMEVPFDAEV